MEKQLLFLLDWDLNISAEDLYEHFEPFLFPIRGQIKKQEEEEQALIALRDHEVQQVKIRMLRKAQTLPIPSSLSRPLTPCSDDGQEPYLLGSHGHRYIAPHTPLDTPSRNSRSWSSSRSSAASSLSTYKRALDRSRSRSTHRRSYMSLDRLSYQTPPASGKIPDLARSGSMSSASSRCSSPSLPSPDLVAQRHALPDIYVDHTSMKQFSIVGNTGKPTKKAKSGIFTRFLSYNNNGEKCYSSKEKQNHTRHQTAYA